ncbi:hypothetical protein J7337_005641 [Fusarium musae]|uniref:Pectate lyase n=1 Tax=Fusarium musae TaxID=1042133 RepID=A0A9P8IRC3_9HYPO|nr:hypothetical protein J7337_005641 [Fusarium musae]KAG9502807.1 hypothetical protein J7337_005641 [Fusarium musae]
MLILEDDATLRSVLLGPVKLRAFTQNSGTSTICGEGAFHAADKVVQFSGGGTVEISDFYVEDYGKLVRSCGNCQDNGGVLGGTNTNYGDTCTMSNACEDSGKNCDLFKGDSGGSEPS